MSRETFTIESVETKPSSGGNFKRVKMNPGGFASVWAAGDQDFVEEHLGKLVTAEIVVKDAEKGWKNASAFAEASTSDSAPLGASASSGLDEEGWRKKEDRERLGILYSVHLDKMQRWLEAHPEAATTAAVDSYADLCVMARKQAAKDLEYIKSYVESDVPFG